MSEKWIHWFEELGKEHNQLVGKKCANLGEMTRLGLEVPSIPNSQENNEHIVQVLVLEGRGEASGTVFG